MEKQKQAQSAQALLIASRALHVAEQELGYLPAEGWERQAGYVVDAQKFHDPNRDPRIVLSGWGVNTRTQLRNGIAKKDPDDRKRADLPPDAILMMAWHDETFTPKRNGGPDLPTDPNGNTFDPRARHGHKTPVIRVDGSMALLSFQELEDALRLKHQPESAKGKAILEKEITEIKQKMETDREGHTSFPGYVTLEKGSITTPKIPKREKAPKLTFEVQSPIQQEVAARIVFLNELGKEVNYNPKSKTIWAETAIDVTQRELGRPWKTKDGKTTLQNPGFNPYMGHAERLERASYPKETGIVETFKTRVERTTLTGPEWQTITLQASTVPHFTTHFQIEFEKAGISPVIIRNIRIRFE